ncbi:MAG: hydroxyethylthiazole kinase [Rhodospirillaceae bacterium]|nr:hydroxyethylthiazole kinase [Rhodospirillaceae bacterium]
MGRPVIAPMPLADGLAGLRNRRPVIHSITNPVAIALAAGVLQAVGARPVMTEALEEMDDVVRAAAAVTVNIGMPSTARADAMVAAAAAARQAGRPWVLDPVGVGASPHRRGLMHALLANRPTVIRGNADEVLALADMGGLADGIGIDAQATVEAALPAAAALAQATASVVMVTGKVDHVTDGVRSFGVANGHPMMTRVSGLGCALTCLTGAALAVEPDPLTAAVLAAALMGVAGEIAATSVAGPATLAAGIVDTLFGLDARTFQRTLRVQ